MSKTDTNNSFSTQLATRFREVVLNGQWIANTNLKMALEDVPFEVAIKEISGLNTIASLTFHIQYYIGGVLNVFEGGALEIRDKFSFDMPTLAGETDWIKLKEALYTKAEQFASEVQRLGDENLGEVFVNPEYGDYRRNIEGMIEHCYYHLGQIVLIKKLLNPSPK